MIIRSLIRDLSELTFVLTSREKTYGWNYINLLLQELTKRAEQFGLILDDISITHCTFGREFTQAVELKQVAQQDAEKAR